MAEGPAEGPAAGSRGTVKLGRGLGVASAVRVGGAPPGSGLAPLWSGVGVPLGSGVGVGVPLGLGTGAPPGELGRGLGLGAGLGGGDVTPGGPAGGTGRGPAGAAPGPKWATPATTAATRPATPASRTLRARAYGDHHDRPAAGRGGAVGRRSRTPTDSARASSA
ncbi:MULTISPECIES: hypothetical protein [Streptomyces]|uniref:hypothetical protein n=1 Tax=Streptomyces TaxID=1883 RepID=UPI0007CD484B|nr:hypothetical protein A4V12_03775 [Streptomyces noursei]